MKTNSSEKITNIDAVVGWNWINFREIWKYRDLFYFLIRRDIMGRYAHSILGVGWAVIQPVFSMVVFTIIFGNLTKVDSEGVPYAIFSYAALLPWTYFSNSLSGATGSLVGSSGIIKKVYFPRIIIPITPVLGKLVDFAIASIILFIMMVAFGITPTIGILVLPLLILLMILFATGTGMMLTALAIQYRDIQYGMNLLVTMLMYASPVVYPASLIPEQYQYIYALNPMVGVIEGFRAALLGTRAIPWEFIGIGTAVSLVIFVLGGFYFRRMENIFTDVA